MVIVHAIAFGKKVPWLQIWVLLKLEEARGLREEDLLDPYGDERDAITVIHLHGSLELPLQQLLLGHNNLSGALPCSALRHLTKLQTLDLQHNKLEGKVQ